MFRITKLADYGTVVMAVLAQDPQNANARLIADKTHLSLPTVSKILKLLLNHQLLVSTRGAQGGYALARAAHEIKLIDILTAMGDEFAMTECCQMTGHCDVEAFCHVRGHWRTISRVVRHAIEGITLADMLQDTQKLQHQIEVHCQIPPVPKIREEHHGE